MAGGGNTGNESSAAADKARVGGRHRARLGNRGRSGGRRDNPYSKSLGLQGDDRGYMASKVAHESSGVGDEEGGREASRVAENPRGSRQGVGRGVKSPQGINTSRVAELPRGDETPGVTTTGEGEPGEDRWGR